MGSSKEGGTLLQLWNIIDRRNVGSSMEVKHHVNEIENFLELVVKCHMVAAALHHFGMTSVTDVPHCSAFPEHILQIPVNDHKKMLMKEMIKIIERYVVPREFVSNTPDPVAAEIIANPHAVRVSDEHQYLSIPPPPKRRKLPDSVLRLTPRSHASQAVKKVAKDGVYNYASSVLNDGLLLLEFKDAIREGDGKSLESASTLFSPCWTQKL